MSGVKRLAPGGLHSIAKPTRSGSGAATSKATRHMRSPRHSFIAKLDWALARMKSSMSIPCRAKASNVRQRPGRPVTARLFR